jgi:hypothetical protein
MRRHHDRDVVLTRRGRGGMADADTLSCDANGGPRYRGSPVWRTVSLSVVPARNRRVTPRPGFMVEAGRCRVHPPAMPTIGALRGVTRLPQ